MTKIQFVFIFLGLLIVGCGDSPENRADDLCSCFKEAGIDFDGIENQKDLERLGRKMEKLPKKKEKKAKKCVLEVAKGIQSDIKEMDDKETAEYMKSLAQSALDTECVVEAMEDADYSDMKDMFDDMIEAMEDDMD
jgi:hypothetical protein